MKKIIAVILCFVSLQIVQGQEYDPVPPYQKDSTIPTFSIIETDSVTWFNKAALPENMPVVIIYFNPECGHCQLTAHDFQEKSKKLKNVFFVWVTYDTSFNEIRSFEEQYHLDGKNVRVGRDPKYYVPSFFRVRYTPFMAVYNSSGKLVKTYETGTDPETIIRLLHL